MKKILVLALTLLPVLAIVSYAAAKPKADSDAVIVTYSLEPGPVK